MPVPEAVSGYLAVVAGRSLKSCAMGRHFFWVDQRGGLLSPTFLVGRFGSPTKIDGRKKLVP